MEVTIGFQHAVYPIQDTSRVGEARRAAVQLANECGFDDVAVGRVALAVTELTSNLARHAQGGELWVRRQASAGQVELIAIDRGPGIADLNRALGDGFSTGGTPGTGLGAVKRLAHGFEMHSVPGLGTVTVARLQAGEPARAWARPPVLVVAAAAIAAPGETVCGDGWGHAIDGDRASLIVADGLGHGPDAHHAARTALDVFQREPFAPPRALMAQVHAALRSTRGAAVALVQVDASKGSVRSSTLGNVLGRLVSGTSDRTLLGQHGTAGLAIRSIDETEYVWPPHALLILCTDGIETRWKPETVLPILTRDPSLAAATILRDHCRGRDDATVLVLQRSA